MRGAAMMATLVLAVVLAACAGDELEEVTPPVGESPEEAQEPVVDPGGLEAELQLAVADAAAEAGVDAEEVEVVEVEVVTWPDGSLGCPQEGGMYTQALEPGYRVVVRVAGEERHYHGAEAQEPFHCDDPQPPVEGR